MFYHTMCLQCQCGFTGKLIEPREATSPKSRSLLLMRRGCFPYTRSRSSPHGDRLFHLNGPKDFFGARRLSDLGACSEGMWIRGSLDDRLRRIAVAIWRKGSSKMTEFHSSAVAYPKSDRLLVSRKYPCTAAAILLGLIQGLVGFLEQVVQVFVGAGFKSGHTNTAIGFALR